MSAREEWGVSQCPLKENYWRRELNRCGFKEEFKTWMLRTIIEGVDLGHKFEPRDHTPRHRVRTPHEIKLLRDQYKVETELGRVVRVGEKRPSGKCFPKFFVSPTYIQLYHTKKTGD